MRTGTRFRRRWSGLAPRLIAGFAILIALTMTISVVSLVQLGGLTATTTEVASRDLPEVSHVAHLQTLLVRQIDLNETGGPAVAASVKTSNLVSRQITLARRIEPIGTGNIVLAESALIRPLISGLLSNQRLTQEGSRLLHKPGRTEAGVAIFTRQQALIRHLTSITDDLLALEQREAQLDAARAKTSTEAATTLVLALTILSVPVALLTSLLLTWSMTRPLSSLLRATDKLAAGDLDASPNLSGQDEVSQLGAAFDAMRLRLQATIRDAELARERTQAIIDATTDGVVLVDSGGRVVRMNPATESLAGCHSDDAAGRLWQQVLGCPIETEILCDSDRSGTTVPSATGASERVKEIAVTPATGNTHWLALSAVPLRVEPGEESSGTTVLTFHDISELKAIDRMKSDFVAMVSHELRAPLAAVAGSVELLSDSDGLDEGTRTEIVGILQQQTARLEDVIQNVLEVVRLESGRMNVRLQAIDLNPLVEEECKQLTQGWLDGRVVTITRDEAEPAAWVDPAALRLILRNLLENARAYTPNGTPIEVVLSSDPSRHLVVVAVNDCGPGIDPNQIQHIFDRFSRLPNPDWVRGYGLGLYIARELMLAHGGQITVSNRPAGGASFRLVFPAVVGELSPDDPSMDRHV